MIKKLLFILLLSYSVVSLYPHGVDIVVVSGGTGVEARYGSGVPVSYAEITIYSPGNKEEPFQAGVTDRNGRFLFSPDSDGEWRVIINDGSGHGGASTIIMKDFSPVRTEAVGKPVGRWMKILTGVAVIFGLTGILFFALARRERKRGKIAHS